MVGVYFGVLVGDFLFFEDEPNALDKGAEPAGVEFEGLVGLVGLWGFVLEGVFDWVDGLGVATLTVWIA